MNSAQQPVLTPFDLEAPNDYRLWREHKLADYPREAAQLLVEIADPYNLTQNEKKALRGLLRKTNLAIYRLINRVADKVALREMGRQLGLVHLDGNLCADEDNITSLQVVAGGRHRGYIPYTNKPLSWHTDGYYNAMDHQVQAILLHCDTPAWQGGENALLDHEILYLHLRDQDPDLISALMHPQAMVIPPNVEGGEEIRGETVGPVYRVMADGHLHMRYSARTRNIRWREDAATAAAVEYINTFLNSDSPYVFRYTLQANEGVISNNVLHNRTGFEDSADSKRLLYRARYYDRIAQT